MASIYLSYLPGDNDAATERLYDHLGERFGRDAVNWREPGSASGDAPATLRDAVVVVALIGPNWLQGTAQHGALSLSEPESPVRREIEAALGRRIPIIPVLAQGAALPQAPYLPPSLRPLAQLTPLPLRNDPDFRRDAERVIEALSRYLAPLSATGGARRLSVPAFALLAGLALLVIALSAAGVVFAARSGIGVFNAGPVATPTATPIVQRTPTLVTVMRDPLTEQVSYSPVDYWLINAAGTCSFANGGYQVVGSKTPQRATLCFGPGNASAVDERASITTRLATDDNPQGVYGLYFHSSDGAAATGYEFVITPSGGWQLLDANSAQALASGTSSAIHAGPGAVNTLTVDVYGTLITLAVNGARVGQLSDATYSAGRCGVLVEHGLTVIYSNFLFQRYS